MICRAFLVLGAILATPMQSHAGDTPGGFAVRGLGNISCGRWTEQRQTKGWPNLVAESWVNGFVTAYDEFSATGTTFGEGVDGAAITAWIDNYCAAHPLDNLATATAALVIELKGRAAPGR